MTTTAPSTRQETPGDLVRAWLYLVWLCFQRQARARQMVWIALALLGFTAVLVALNAAGGRWGMKHWRYTFTPPERAQSNFYSGPPPSPKGQGGGLSYPPPPPIRLTYDEAVSALELAPRAGELATAVELLPLRAPVPTPSTALLDAVAAAARAILNGSGFTVFSNWIVFSIFLSFLMPIWSLSFATEALGGEREGRSLVWLLTRPLPRSSIYLAKFVGMLPWSIGLNVGGFALLCVLAGQPGRQAFALFWPAVLWGTLAFCSLFHLMAACFRRAAVVALVYSFFLETILGNMPGLLKRVSLGFYTRCMMFEAAQDYGIQPEKPSVYLPVSGTTAWLVLAGVTVVLLVAGMAWFSRTEYQDLT